MRKYKIAICFRGLIRTGIENRVTFSHYFDSRDWDIDYFCHTWDYENIAPPFIEAPTADTDLWKELRDRPTSTLNKFKVSKFNKVYGLKKFHIQSFYDFRKLDNISSRLPDDMFVMTFHPQFVSCYQSNRLRIEYEKETGTKYDLVINTRPDIIIDPNNHEKLFETINQQINSTENSIGIVNIPPNWDYDLPFYDDVMYTGKPEIMNTFMEHFNPKSNTSHHNKLGEYMKNNGIKLVPLSINYNILRNYLSFYHPIEEYNEIFIGNLLFYYTPESISHFLESNKELKSMYEQYYKKVI